MSIAALLQAAEYLERRERGKLGRVSDTIVKPESTSTWLPCQLLAWKSADFDALVIFFITEAEHGYASTLPMPDDLRSVKRPKTKKSQGSRTTHNELEKNR
ncbi:Max dimerization protein 1 [Blattella germanica]|nr:Max dimerization protein 1 [Blattella germanica]